MSFAYPWVLFLIPVALLLMRQRRKRTSVQVASTDLWQDKNAGRAAYLWVPVFLRRTSIVLLIIGLARPQGSSTDHVEVSEGIAIQMLVDVSSSMDMNISDRSGLAKTRLELAKELVEVFILGDHDQLSGRKDDLIGLITFARYADTRSPLTFGHEALVQIVRYLETQERPNEDGTAYGDALAIAAARLKNLEELKHSQDNFETDSIKSRVIILLTDGENNSGSHLPVESAGLAKEWGCRIYTVSLGESTGESLSAAENVLSHISVETGGLFRKAHDYDSLLSVYREIDDLERTRIATRGFERVAEWFWLPLALAILTLLLALLLEATILRVVP